MVKVGGQGSSKSFFGPLGEFLSPEDALWEDYDLYHRCAGEKQLCGNQFPLVNRIFFKALQGARKKTHVSRRSTRKQKTLPVQARSHSAAHTTVYIPCKYNRVLRFF